MLRTQLLKRGALPWTSEYLTPMRARRGVTAAQCLAFVPARLNKALGRKRISGAHMKNTLVIVLAVMIAGCNQVTITTGDSVSEAELEHFFRKHQVGRNHAVALKKNSLGSISYLATIHGYPNNHSVCAELIVPYNKNASLSTIPGTYFCEELR